MDTVWYEDESKDWYDSAEVLKKITGEELRRRKKALSIYETGVSPGPLNSHPIRRARTMVQEELNRRFEAQMRDVHTLLNS